MVKAHTKYGNNGGGEQSKLVCKVYKNRVGTKLLFGVMSGWEMKP